MEQLQRPPHSYVFGRSKNFCPFEEGVKIIQSLLPGFEIPEGQKEKGNMELEGHQIRWYRQHEEKYFFEVTYPAESSPYLVSPDQNAWGQSTGWDPDTLEVE
jgi:hypothetical protein